uniref:F-box and WD repeat domain containing 7 n=1 Tax=Malurus cyaneus samueli TaxID=2593467 RepID=A0A8C5TSA3_9PASS
KINSSRITVTLLKVKFLNIFVYLLELVTSECSQHWLELTVFISFQSGSRDATLRVWDIETGQCLHVLMGHVAAVRCVQYDGRRVVSGAYDFMVKVWDPETETCLHTLQGHTNRVYSLQVFFLPLLTQNIILFIHKVKASLPGIERRKKLISCLCLFTPQSGSGSLDTSIRVWDVETGNCIHTLTGHQSLTSGMELKDNILVSGNADSTVKIWDIKTGQCLQTLQGKLKPPSCKSGTNSAALTHIFICQHITQYLLMK